MLNNFSFPLKIYYEDTDSAGIVYYANYLKFFERARTEWFREIGIGQKTIYDCYQKIFIVKNADINYHLPAKLDDSIKVNLKIKKIGKVIIIFFQEAWKINDRNSKLVCSAIIKVGCINAISFRPAKIPPEILNIIKINN